MSLSVRIKRDDKYIENVTNVVYLVSSIASNALMDTEISCPIDKGSGTFAQLSERVLNNPKLTIHTKSTVYRACVCSTLQYGSKTWTLSIVQEKKN